MNYVWLWTGVQWTCLRKVEPTEVRSAIIQLYSGYGETVRIAQRKPRKGPRRRRGG